MTARLATLDEAVGVVADGSTVVIGGAVLRRKPMAMCRALAASARHGLTVVTFAGSLDVEVLLAAGAVEELWTAYVGLGHHGLAPRFRAAGDTGEVVDREFSEWTLLGALRAGAMGLPFLPTRAGHGSEVVGDLALRDVVDPYTDQAWTAVPALRPDVALLHAWRASPEGDVQFPWPPEHLWDVDVLAARAADVVVVTVDRLAPREDMAASDHLTRLFGFEVDLVVEAPAGAWPTASPPTHDVDQAAVAAYLASGGDVDVLEPSGPGDAAGPTVAGRQRTGAP